jgi:hypothetical protein
MTSGNLALPILSDQEHSRHKGEGENWARWPGEF